MVKQKRFEYYGNLSHAVELLSNVQEGSEYLNDFLKLAKKYFPADNVIFSGHAIFPVKFTQTMDGKPNEYLFYPSVKIWYYDKDIYLELKNAPADSNKINLERLAKSMIHGELKNFSAWNECFDIKGKENYHFNPINGLSIRRDNIIIANRVPKYVCSDLKREHVPALTYGTNVGKNGVVLSETCIYDINLKGKSRNFGDIVSQQMPKLNVYFKTLSKNVGDDWQVIHEGMDWNNGNPKLK